MSVKVMNWYWPVAVAVSVAAFIAGTFAGFAGWALAVGAVVIGAPEVTFLLGKKDDLTLSDWWWRVFHISQRSADTWHAAEVFGLGAVLAVEVRAVGVLAGYGYWPAAASAVLAMWLPPHLFERWWR